MKNTGGSRFLPSGHYCSNLFFYSLSNFFSSLFYAQFQCVFLSRLCFIYRSSHLYVFVTSDQQHGKLRVRGFFFNNIGNMKLFLLCFRRVAGLYFFSFLLCAGFSFPFPFSLYQREINQVCQQPNKPDNNEYIQRNMGTLRDCQTEYRHALNKDWCRLLEHPKLREGGRDFGQKTTQ